METENRTNNQVEGIIFRRDANKGTEFLLMRRVSSRGGFWQPLTGGVRVGEDLETALRREVLEETGLSAIDRIINTEYVFNFSDNGKDYTEYVFGVEVPTESSVILSDEHDSLVWGTEDQTRAMLKWPGNIEGFTRLCLILKVE